MNETLQNQIKLLRGLSLLRTYRKQHLGHAEHPPQRHDSHGHKHSSATLDWHSLVAMAAGLLQLQGLSSSQGTD
jgi:hypothetical protein